MSPDYNTVAWRGYNNRTGQPAAWSKTHYTLDHGTTTLCGARVMPDPYDSDDYGTGNRCHRCERIRKATAAASRSSQGTDTNDSYDCDGTLDTTERRASHPEEYED